MELEFLSLLWSSESREAGQFARFRVVTPNCVSDRFRNAALRNSANLGSGYGALLKLKCYLPRLLHPDFDAPVLLTTLVSLVRSHWDRRAEARACLGQHAAAGELVRDNLCALDA